MSPVRVHRLDPSDPISGGRPIFRPRTSFSVAARATAGARLDLGARIALAADIQASAGNRAMAHVAGFARADHRTPPPGGIKDIGEAAHSPGNRGFTQSRYTANPPLFRPGRNDPVGGGWEARPASVRLPELDFDVWWPAPRGHRLGNYGKGGWYLDVTEEWSDKLRQGEEEHVTDTEQAYSMTWGKVASIVNEMAAAQSGSKGGTVEGANQAAWKGVVGRLPKGLKQAGDGRGGEPGRLEGVRRPAAERVQTRGRDVLGGGAGGRLGRGRQEDGLPAADERDEGRSRREALASPRRSAEDVDRRRPDLRDVGRELAHRRDHVGDAHRRRLEAAHGVEVAQPNLATLRTPTPDQARRRDLPGRRADRADHRERLAALRHPAPRQLLVDRRDQWPRRQVHLDVRMRGAVAVARLDHRPVPPEIPEDRPQRDGRQRSDCGPLA